MGAPALAVASGLSLVAAHPPVGLWPLSFLTVPLLLAAITVDARARDRGPRAGQLGLLAGVVLYLPLFAWLAGIPAGWLAWPALASVQALFVAAAALLMSPFVAYPGRQRRLAAGWIVVAAPVVWTGLDAWRALWPLGGFGWGAIAYTHVDGSWLAPLARVAGGRAITFTVVLLGVLAFEAVRRVVDAPAGDVRGRAAALTARLPAARVALLGLVGVLAATALVTVPPPAPTGRSLDVLAVQGNDDDSWFWLSRADVDRRIAAQMLALTEDAVARGGRPDVTIWPESSVDRDPFSAGGADLLPLVERAAATAGGNLLVGSYQLGPRPLTYFNAALLFDADGDVVDRYAKRRLVPFGEYVPLRGLLGSLPVMRPDDGIPGPGADLVRLAGGARLAVATCFETLFPEVVRGNVLSGQAPAGLLVATTNDAAFGRGAEPAQHLAQTRLRAIETGRHAVHASLSGSSAFVDASGRVSQATGLFTQATIRADLPLVTGLTPYLVFGDVVGVVTRALVVALAVVLSALAAVAARRRRPSP